jgi:hypothetical protein
MLQGKRFVVSAAVLAAALLLLGPYAGATDPGGELFKDFRAQLTQEEIQQLDAQKKVEVDISTLPDEMVERAVDLSHYIFWAGINDKKSQPEKSTLIGGVLGIAKGQLDAKDPTIYEVLIIRLTWHDPELDHTFTVEGIYVP